jgi:type IX secretion system PorP/SprF family membrane protein
LNLTAYLLKFLVAKYLHLSRKNIQFLLVVTFLLSVAGLHAQSNYLFTHYMFTNMAINPAYAGSNGGICATGLVRSQWMGFKDGDGNKVSPQTFLLTVEAPIRAIHGGVGGSIMQDSYGFFKNTSVKVGYAYRADMGAGTFSAGLNVGFQNANYDFSKFVPGEEGDPLLQNSGKTSDMIFDIDAGLFYQVPDKWYVGLSGNNLLQMKGKKVYYQTRRTYYVMGGYQWVVPGSPLFEIDPSALLMYDGASFQFGLSALVVYNKKFYGGVGYRLQDAISVLAGVTIKGLKVGVSYDIGTSAIAKYNNGGLEVMVSYCFKIERDKFRKSYRNTRFL